MRFVQGEEIRRALTFEVLIADLEAAHRRPKIEIQDGYLGDERGHYFVRHAVDPGRFMASKLITSFPENLVTGAAPAVQAVCVVFDGRDGRPIAVLDGTEVTYWRTAADSALGAKLLASDTPEILLIVGAGGLSRWLVRGHLTVKPSLRRILIWNRTPERAAELARELQVQGLDAAPVSDLNEAIRAADLISSCTRSHIPLVCGENLKRGAHLDLVGGYSPQSREADDDAARRSRVFVDRRETAFHGVGDILGPLASGAIKQTDVLGDLYDLVSAGVRGRVSEGDITFFKNAGGAHLDLMTCEVILRHLGVIGE